MEYYLQKKKIIKNREMRNFTFKGLFLAVVFMVLGSLSIQAADDGLITKQITVKLEKAGTLRDKIGSTKRDKITNLKIIGEINGSDWSVIRYMAGRDYYGSESDGKLAILDLSETKIVSGGGRYLYDDYYIDYFYTHDNELGSRAFYNCSGLTSLSLPSGITSIGWEAFSGCSGLTSLSFPSGITSIGGYAFSGCSGLTSIYVYAEKLPNMESDVFDGCDAKKCTVYVPKGTYDDYWLSEFGYFENIVEFDPTGINNVITSNDTKELSRYSLNGQRLSAPTKGLNIVKYSDGSVKKVVVQ